MATTAATSGTSVATTTTSATPGTTGSQGTGTPASSTATAKTAKKDSKEKVPPQAPKLSANELERVTEVFKMYETGLREATIYPKVGMFNDIFVEIVVCCPVHRNSAISS